jgi:hypothetical protein
MLATCAYAYATAEGAVIGVQGDGAIAWKLRSGDVHMRRYEWAGNIPFYPAYCGADRAAFIAAHGGDPGTMAVSEISLTAERGLTLAEGMAGIAVAFTAEALSLVEYVAVFTDGIAQIDGVDWRDAVTEFLAFKNNVGEFAKRRMIRGIRDMQKIGKGPVDDIAYAVIHIKEEPPWEAQGAVERSASRSTDAGQ